MKDLNRLILVGLIYQMKSYPKILFCIALISCLLVIPAYAQEGNVPPCDAVKQVNLATDSLKRRILFEFIRRCTNEGGFSSAYDKGIVHLYEYRDEKNQLCWKLLPTIINSYEDNPPTRFMDLGGDIFLIYEADSKGRALKTTQDKGALNACLEQIVGDRVLLRPKIRSRWTSDVLPNMKRKEGNRRNQLGNGGSEIIIFHNDGTYKRLFPA